MPPEPAEPRAGMLVQVAVSKLGWYRGTWGHRSGAVAWPKALDSLCLPEKCHTWLLVALCQPPTVGGLFITRATWAGSWPV